MHFIPAVHDKLTRGRIHRASIWIPLLLIAWFIVLNAVVAPSALAFKTGAGCSSDAEATSLVVVTVYEGSP